MMSLIEKRDYRVLGLITFFGLALRLPGLRAQSLWNDEFFSWLASTRPRLWDLLAGVRADELTPPVFFVVQWLSARVFGASSEFLIRLPALVAGTLAIPAVFLLGREAFGRRAGLLSALLFAGTYQPIYFSQEARAYGLTILFAALSSWRLLVFLRVVRGGGSGGREAAHYVLWASLLSLTHYFGALMVLAQGLSWIFLISWRTRATFLRWLAVYGAVVACFGAWLFYLLLDYPGRSPRLEDFNGGEIFVYHRWLFGGSSVYGIASTVAILAMVVRAVRESSKTSPRARMSAVFALWVFMPFVVAYAIAVKVMAIYTIRYMVIGLPAIYVLTGAAAADVFERSRRARWVGAAVACVFVFLGLFETVVARGHYRLPKSEQVRESIEWVRDEALGRYPESAIATSALRSEFVDFYLARLGVSRKVDYWAPDVESVKTLRGRLRPDARHLIFLAPGFGSREAELPRALLESFVFEEEKSFNRASVWILSPRANGSH